MLKKIEVGKSLLEQIVYPDITFPFNVWIDVFNDFIDYTVNCHWHYDFEFVYVLSGSVDYYINDTHIKLNKDDCVFVNSNMLHMGKQSDNCNNAVMFTITFPASVLTTNINSSIYAKYFQSIVSSKIEGFKICNDNPHGQEVKKILMEIYSLESSEFGYELECLKRLNHLWLILLSYVDDMKDSIYYHAGSNHHVERAKEILSYIHSNYNEKFTIDEIAKNVNISRSECFRSFKRFMNKKPVEYINEYRLMKAAKLIRETEKSIANIYSECGFENAGYFNKIFKETYGMTPLQYRKTK